MALKRKRSTPSLPSPLSTTSNSTTATTPLSYFYNQSKPIDALYQKSTWSFPTYESDEPVSSHHLGSRTRKRHRDDRPDENSVHANTISKLFSAQREHPHAEPVPSFQPQQQTAMPAVPQKSTLHSFWSISSTPVAPPQSNTMMVDADSGLPAYSASRPETTALSEWMCEDCEGYIRLEDNMEMDENWATEETLCHGCRRRVCDGCAVLWDQRLCLGCARMR